MPRLLPVCVLILVITLAACGRPTPAPASAPAIAETSPPQADHRYQAPSGAFSIVIPADVQRRDDFHRSYMDNGAWKAYAGRDSHGQPVLALVLPGSNKITAAELRIGVSDQASEVTDCTNRPGAAVGVSDEATINDTAFSHFHARDAAMNHYLDVQAYRAVHDGRCYAIDLWIAGTNPQVYDPPATPPFSRAEAVRRLHALLATFRFNG